MSEPICEMQVTGVHGRGRSSPRNAFISLAAVCCAIALAAMSLAASGADPNKALHVALVAPETGFDPQAASDLYSKKAARVTTKQKFPDTLKMGRAGQLQMWGLSNTATNDEGSGFLDPLYGPHKGVSNLSRFDLAEFNALYDEAKRLPGGPKHVQLFRRMSTLVTAYAP